MQVDTHVVYCIEASSIHVALQHMAGVQLQRKSCVMLRFRGTFDPCKTSVDFAQT